MLSKINKHELDSRIKFRENGHKYWIDNKSKDLISSTTFIHTFFSEFDIDKIISGILNSNKYKDPEYKYFGMSAEDIKQSWKTNGDSSRDLGTHLHKDIEDYYNGKQIENDSIEFKQFLRFKEEFNYEVYRTEWLIFSDILRITGSIDIVFKNEDGTLSLGDWKRSKEIVYEGFNGKCGKFPLNHIPDCNFYHYSLQLNLYRVILEKFYGKTIKEMFLVVLHPNNKNDFYQKIPINKLDKEIEMLLDHRKQELLKKGYSETDLNKVKLEYSLKDAIIDEVSDEEPTVIKSFLRRKPIVDTPTKLVTNVAEQHKKSFLRGKLKDIEKEIKIETETEDLEPKKMIKLEDLSYLNLSKIQRKAYKLIQGGKNIFLTGRAGSGKSAIINLFRKQYKISKNIGLTSTTGTSAILIGGSTVHSYLGIGLGTGDVEFLYMNIKNRGYILKRWLDLDTLIIDEVSMLSPDLFDKIEHLARVVRKSDLPFGGIQLILTGDFLQLPCVNSVKFCFESKSWNKCVDEIVYLKQIYRQTDLDFQKCLSEVRMGELSQESIDLLRAREDVVLKNDLGILPTKLYALNKNVDEENEKEMNKLFMSNTDLEFYEYEMEYEIIKKGIRNPEEKIQKGCNAQAKLELCEGTQVMLLYNMDLDAKLANGSRGVVVKFIDDLPVVRFLTGEERIIDYYTWKIQENGVDIISIKQIPLKIAYAVSIHKSQGMTVDYAIVDMEGIFEDGQAYVALSRVSSKDGLSIKNFRTGNILVNIKAVEFYKKLE